MSSAHRACRADGLRSTHLVWVSVETLSPSLIPSSTQFQHGREPTGSASFTAKGQHPKSTTQLSLRISMKTVSTNCLGLIQSSQPSASCRPWKQVRVCCQHFAAFPPDSAASGGWTGSPCRDRNAEQGNCSVSSQAQRGGRCGNPFTSTLCPHAENWKLGDRVPASAWQRDQ